MKSVDYRTNGIFGGGRIQIRDRSLRLSFPLIPSTFAQTQDIIPDECCSDAPGDHLLDAAADLLAFFDKWYGAAGRTTVDGFYIWSNASCPPLANLRVPTATHLDDVSQAGPLCANPPEIFEPFNALRDAVLIMAGLVSKRPRTGNFIGAVCPATVPCKQLKKFRPLFTPTRSCTKPAPCIFPSDGTSPGTRAIAGDKLCTHHYIELEGIIDEMMTDGVVEIDHGTVGGVLVKSGTPCGSPFADDLECVQVDKTTYVDSAKTSCCNRSNCCFAASATLTGFSAKRLDGRYSANTGDACCLPECYFCDADCPASPMVDADISKWWGANLITYTQNGTAVFKFAGTGDCAQCSWEVPVSVSLRHVNMSSCNPGLNCDFTDTTTAEDDETLTVTRESDGTWSIGTFTGPFAGGCTGVSAQVGDEFCQVIGITVIINNAEWANFTVDPDNSGCGSNCACQECPCPGTVDSNVVTDTRPAIGLTNPTTVYNITRTCGRGAKFEADVSALLKYSRDCPDSGLTNIVMLDDRINTINSSTFTNTTLSAPLLNHPGCPGSSRLKCAPFECLRGYGELA